PVRHGRHPRRPPARARPAPRARGGAGTGRRPGAREHRRPGGAMSTTGTLRDRARQALAAACATVLVVVLGACASIPTSGPVVEGQATPEDPGQPFVSALPPPRDGAPAQIVRGFLAAQAPRSEERRVGTEG